MGAVPILPILPPDYCVVRTVVTTTEEVVVVVSAAPVSAGAAGEPPPPQPSITARLRRSKSPKEQK